SEVNSVCVSVPIPSPYFPEPITVAGNVGSAGYAAVVRYTRSVALGHLLSLLAIVGLTAAWMRPQGVERLLSYGPEPFWVATLAAFVLLAIGRHAPLALQLVIFSVFAVGVSGTAALWAPVVVEDFPDFAKAIAWTFSSGWVALFLYNIAASRDYSYLGQYVLVWLATGLSIVVYTWLSDIVLSLAFASFVVFSAVLFYYLYDLSMILRRRLPHQVVAGALDLYRDALNFVGFPVRVMRMPRGLRRKRD
ncbi:MAG: hypothetical protein M3R13_11565, partial [Armatimonadota bacterium]|nr:hypothetical protein [Armatimonadota bacterium]